MVAKTDIHSKKTCHVFFECKWTAAPAVYVALYSSRPLLPSSKIPLFKVYASKGRPVATYKQRYL